MAERIGRWIFAVAIAAIGVTSIVWAKASVIFVKCGSHVLPIMPYPPAIVFAALPPVVGGRHSCQLRSPLGRGVVNCADCLGAM